METLLLTSNPMSKQKIWNRGQLDLTAALGALVDKPNCFFEDVFPDVLGLQLDWEEYASPQIKAAYGEQLLNGKLGQYRFQYLGNFSMGDFHLSCELEHYRALDFFETEQLSLGTCNLTWLVDFLLNADKIAKSLHRKECLRAYRPEAGGYVLALEADFEHHREVQKICFAADFRAYTWSYTLIDKGRA